MHKFHIWQLAGDRVVTSAHINLAQYMHVAEKVKEFFHNEGTTIQPEYVKTNEPTGSISSTEARTACSPALRVLTSPGCDESVHFQPADHTK